MKRDRQLIEAYCFGQKITALLNESSESSESPSEIL